MGTITNRSVSYKTYARDYVAIDTRQPSRPIGLGAFLVSDTNDVVLV